uniref:hypothetical protein n=1 Tax=Roseococcus thiosulfatophilus TaxID=35813 RepID=UPI001A8C5B53
IFIAKESGAAGIQFLHDLISVGQTANAEASLASTLNLSAIFRVTVPGTLVLGLSAACVAGSASVAAGGAQIIAHRF